MNDEHGSTPTPRPHERTPGEEFASTYHVPAMLREVLEYLDVRENGLYVDATLGGGGYTEAILRSKSNVTVVGFDTDPNAIAFATERLRSYSDRFVLVSENFVSLEDSVRPILASLGRGAIDGIVYELGVSSHQLDTTSIGLSYRVEAPLDMRLDPRLPRSARDVVRDSSEAELKRIFREYGEENYAGPLARKVVRAREKKPIETTTALAEILTDGIPEPKKNPTLSRVFQALRIEVNGELENLRSSLEQAIELLAPHGRLVVVSYHSLEDRIVKEVFREASAPALPVGSLQALKENIDRTRVRLRVLTRKPLQPGEEELERNVRSRSARLRAAEKSEAAA